MKSILSIIRSINVHYVVPIVQVLLEEGIQDIEVSLSDGQNGIDCIKELDSNFRGTDLNLGAGTVINQEQVDYSLKAGANYIIMPGWEKNLVRYIIKTNTPVIPGVFSPSEIMQAVNEGLNLLKLFPAGSVGVGFIKSLFGPFPNIQLVAVGGINSDNAKMFLQSGCISLGIGNELVPRAATLEDLDKIRNNAKIFNKIVNN